MALTDIALLNLGGTLGAFGLVSWLVRHTFTHTIPRLAESFERNLKGLQESFREELRSQREDFRAELQSERETYAERLEELTKTVDRLSTVILFQAAAEKGINPHDMNSIEELLSKFRSKE